MNYPTITPNVYGWHISNMSKSGKSLRDSLNTGEGSHLNWNVATQTWQTFDRAFADRLAAEGFAVQARTGFHAQG